MYTDFYGSLETYSHNSFIETESTATYFSLFIGQFLASIQKHVQLFTTTC